MPDGEPTLTIGVPRETASGERRVALVPAEIARLGKAGAKVLVEHDAGTAAGFPDGIYKDKGAELVDRSALFARADVVTKVDGRPNSESSDAFRSGQTLIATCDPLSEPEQFRALAEAGVTTFALELVPRITRAQSMDVLSSMASIAGYKAVLLAATEAPRLFPMMMTAAGTITPAKVFVVGAGVAGLQAIATAKRLGAVVSAYDVRPAVREQVESLGGKFVEMELDTKEGEGTGGYAREMDEEFYRRQRELMTRVVAEQDIVITTAAIPGRKAPVLVTTEMVEGMPPGSVIVDLAAERGGNCEPTRAGETVRHAGVTVLGPVNIPSSVPFHASEMYSRNVCTFLSNMLSDGELQIDTDDEIVRDTLVTHDGEIVHPRIRESLGLDPRPEPATENTDTPAAENEPPASDTTETTSGNES